MYRTQDCNSLRKSDIGNEVTLAGWIHVSRDHGGVIFIDLRDREGLTQVVFRPEENTALAKEAHSLQSEDVIQVTGKVAPRVPGTENPKLATGDVEVIPTALEILNRADDLPFPIDAEIHNEDFDIARPKRPAIIWIRRATSKLRRRFYRRARRKAHATFWCRVGSRRGSFMHCLKRRSNTSSCFRSLA
jgi:aspartyl-tRNA synthetase